jgi:glycerate 2-kinase
MILIAPTAFKGTLSAREAAAAMAGGARAAVAGREIRVLPLSDGGNGLLDAMHAARGGAWRGAQVTGPLGAPVPARYLVQGLDAVLETAEACGLHLLPADVRAPLDATTRGVGELLLAAAGGTAASGPACGAPVAAERLLVGLGGSATVDAGAGMAAALGWELVDRGGRPIPPGGAGLLRLDAIRPPPTPPRVPQVVVLSDVTNPLLGPDGAAAVFGPQKGASPADVALLDDALDRWARIVARDLGRRVADLPGAGAAGGLGAACAAFLDAPPIPGADWLLELVGFDGLLARASVVVTGEGSWDRQSSMGKVTGEVVRRARDAGVPVLLVAGRVADPPPRGVVTATAGDTILDVDVLADLVREGVIALLRPLGTQ